MHQKGHTSQTQVLSFYKEDANEEIKKILQCDTVFKLVRLRSIDGIPNVFVTTYMPYSLFPHFASIDFSKESFYEQCKKSGHPISSITRHLEVTSADETLAELLQVKEQAPLFYFHSYGYDPEGIPIEYSISKNIGEIPIHLLFIYLDNNDPPGLAGGFFLCGHSPALKAALYSAAWSATCITSCSP